MKRLTLALLSLVMITATYAQQKFNARFNPMAPPIASVEEDSRDYISLNGSWNIMPLRGKAADFKLPTEFKWDDTKIKIPSAWNANAYNISAKTKSHCGGDFVAFPSYPKSWESANIAWMQKEFTLPNDWSQEDVYIHFQAVMGKSRVYVNGNLLGENFEGFLPFEYQITDYLKAGKNEVVVGVARTELFDVDGRYGRRVNVGGSQGKQTAGIWQDVYLFARPKLHISDLFVQPNVSAEELVIEVEVRNTSSKRQSFSLDGALYEWHNLAGKSLIEAPEERGELSKEETLRFDTQKSLTLDASEVGRYTLRKSVKDGDLKYWSPESPNLYGAVIKIDGKKISDTKYERFGWREFKIKGTRVELNGKDIVFKGDSWHYVVLPQMTRRYAWAWYTALKDVGCNTVRLHAQPFPEFYLDVADEMGICVLDETGIWASDGGPKFDSEEYWVNCMSHVEGLVKRDRNHASIFGWSVCNEVLPIIVNAKKGTPKLIQRQVDEINNWVELTRKCDPTRDWISGDGETMRETILPTVIGHYGGMNTWDEWSQKGLPWGMGECSKAYFGTPLQMSVENGNRAYESVQGRMEAVAKECYRLLKEQQKRNAVYQSIFNVAWYSLEPLNLGKSNISTPTKLTEGIFFTQYEEGGIGMQPERLGPYTTTLNPGYDKDLPLYKPWIMFDAVKAANNGEAEPVYCSEKPLERKSYPKGDVANVIVLPSNSSFGSLLESIGGACASTKDCSSKSLIVVDAAAMSDNDFKSLESLQKRFNPTIYIENLSTKSLAKLNKILPKRLELKPYKSTSYLVKSDDRILQNLEHKDLYFSELLPFGESTTKFTLCGEFVDSAQVLVATCPVEWQMWSMQPEGIKTGSVLRSERERAGALAVMVKSGNVYVNTISLGTLFSNRMHLTKTMFSNLGVDFTSSTMTSNFLSSDYKQQSLRFTSVNLGSVGKATNAELLKRISVPNEGMLRASDKDLKNTWGVVNAKENIFDFTPYATAQHTAQYLGFWMYSPRSLVDLLAEPDMPKMDIHIDGVESLVYLNGKRYAVNGGLFKNVPIDKGWNYILVKFIQSPNANTKLSISISSDSDAYLKQLKTVLER